MACRQEGDQLAYETNPLLDGRFGRSSSPDLVGPGKAKAALRKIEAVYCQLSSRLITRLQRIELATELWNSKMNTSDALGMLTKFAVPVVTNGKVCVATTANTLRVYDLH